MEVPPERVPGLGRFFSITCMTKDSNACSWLLPTPDYRRLISSPGTIESKKRKKRRYAVAKKTEAVVDDILFILEGNDERLRAVVRQQLKRLGVHDIKTDTDMQKTSEMTDIEESVDREMWGDDGEP